MLSFHREVLSSVTGHPVRVDVDAGGWVADSFEQDCPAGRLDGTVSTSGHTRLATDAEGVIGIDHGALRIGQMVRPGWGRFGVAYGPLQRRPGLALAVFLVNGHNLSQEYRLKEFGAQVRRWIRGSGAQPVWRQCWRGLRHRSREGRARRVWRWWANRRRNGQQPQLLRENLAIGLFAAPAPGAPLERGNAMLVRAAEGFRNGELCAGVRGGAMPVFAGLQNVQVLYVVILRERGAVYYAAGRPGAHGLGSYPSMRPVGIDAFDETSELYAGVHQGVLGEIGFGIDTRVYGLKAGRLDGMADWFGTAQGADRLTGAGSLAEAEQGGAWRVEGFLHRTPTGAEGSGRAWLEMPAEAGLVHAMVEPREPDGRASLLWRASGDGDGLRLEMAKSGAALLVRSDGRDEQLASDDNVRFVQRAARSVQVLDDGRRITAAVDGQVLFGGPVSVPDFIGERSVGFGVAGGWAVRNFECHAREVEVPASLRIGEPWTELGARQALRDEFSGGAGDLHGRRLEQGDAVWERTFGQAAIEVTGQAAARVAASAERPAPGRTLYTVPWRNPDFVDVEVELTPPGTRPREGHRCRAGLCLWEDPQNYMIVNIWLDDVVEATSVSSFFFRHGFEDLYDAAWTNVGERHAGHGRPMRLQIVCDGTRYHALVNGEPVLYRALSDIYPGWDRLKIHRVGLATNWEWGNDTGTVFRSFIARDR